jgi:hypothetical protein
VQGALIARGDGLDDPDPVTLGYGSLRLVGIEQVPEDARRAISPRQIDRRLGATKRQLQTRRYGRTKPGTFLKHHIPLKTDHWDVTVPGFTELDLVGHPGHRADGEFAHSLNVTDIHTTWGEARAVLGRSEGRVQSALDEIRHALPFRLRGIDSDNGSEFINDHLYRYCQEHAIQFTRGRPYKKDDNAHIEQKNWTHVRKLVGYWRYDTPAAVAALNDLYQHELRLFQNLFLPSVKLLSKERVGARVRRRYDQARTPLERVQACPEADPQAVAALVRLRDRLDPFAHLCSARSTGARSAWPRPSTGRSSGWWPSRRRRAARRFPHRRPPARRSSCRLRRRPVAADRLEAPASPSPTTYAGRGAPRHG